jgi:hypothetical protein
MELHSSFSIEELTAIFERMGIDTSFVKEEIEGRQFWSLDCEFGDWSFSCRLFRDAPFFELAVFEASVYVATSPFKFANQFNEGAAFTKAIVEVDDDGNPEVDDDGDFQVKFESWISFSGGITTQHLELLIDMWILEMSDLIDEDDGDDDIEVEQFSEIETDVRELDIAGQIEWVLEDGISRTARELADRLFVDRHTINSTLYKHSELFVREGGQPPRWNQITQP